MCVYVRRPFTQLSFIRGKSEVNVRCEFQFKRFFSLLSLLVYTEIFGKLFWIPAVHQFMLISSTKKDNSYILLSCAECSALFFLWRFSYHLLFSVWFTTTLWVLSLISVLLDHFNFSFLCTSDVCLCIYMHTCVSSSSTTHGNNVCTIHPGCPLWPFFNVLLIW